MDIAVKRKQGFGFFKRSDKKNINAVANLAGAKTNGTYTVKDIQTEDQDMKDFLFTLGCYQGEEVTIISRLADNLVIAVKDARYSINTELAEAIII